MMNSKLVLTLFIILVLVGCTSKIEGNVVKDDTVKVGALFHLTGPGAFWGTSELDGMNMALKERDVSNVEVVVEDCETDFTKTVTAINKLISFDNVDVMFGPTWFGQTASPIAKERGVTFLSPSAGIVSVSSRYFFSFWSTQSQEVAPILDALSNSRIAIVYDQNEWATTIVDAFMSSAEDHNITVVDVYETAADDKDFRAVITKISALDIYAVFAPFSFYPQQGHFMRQVKELGLIDDDMIYSTSGTENPVLLAEFPQIEGTYYAYPVVTASNVEFNERYFDLYDRFPSPSASYAYDTMNVLLDAVENGCRDSECVSEYLLSLDDYSGVTGKISFDEDGRRAEKQFEIKKVDDGKFKALSST